MTNPTVKFLRVLGARAGKPEVLALVDTDYLVNWKRGQWTCDCEESEFPECPHVPAVEALLDPRVLAGDAS